MCFAVKCSKCSKTTWSGCGEQLSLRFFVHLHSFNLLPLNTSFFERVPATIPPRWTTSMKRPRLHAWCLYSERVKASASRNAVTLLVSHIWLWPAFLSQASISSLSWQEWSQRTAADAHDFSFEMAIGFGTHFERCLSYLSNVKWC